MRFLLLIAAALIGGCAVAPMSADLAGQLKAGQTAVIFSDTVQRIHYLEDKYLVLGVAQVSSESTYEGIWGSSKDLSALHATELSKIGVHAKSIYDLMDESDVTGVIHPVRKSPDESPAKTASMDNQGGGYPPAFLTPELRAALLKHGQDYLVWISWSGFLFHIRTLGLSPMERFNMSWRVFDVKNNALIWHSDILTLQTVTMEGDSGKAFLEGNDLAGLKTEVTNRMRERYTVRQGHGLQNASVGQIMGLEREP